MWLDKPIDRALSQNDAISILDAAHNFYSDAFSSLLQLTLGLLAIGGIVVPLLIGWIQNRRVKMESASLKREMDSLVNLEVVQLRALLSDEVAKEVAEFDKRLGLMESKITDELTKKFNKITGGICHVQANSLISNEDYLAAIESLKGAVSEYCKCRDLNNLQRVIGQLEGECMPKLNKKSFEDEINLEADINKIIKDLSDLKCDGALIDPIARLKKMLSDAKKRV